MRLVLALGGEDGARFLHLPELEGFSAWRRLLDPDDTLWLQELRAHSRTGELDHPGEVPLAGETTLTALESMLEEELGSEALVDVIRVGLAGRQLQLYCERGLGTRIDASRDAELATLLARAAGIDTSRAVRILAGIRDEARGERRLVLTLGPVSTEVLDGVESFTLGD